ncbi:MAG: hypothetical protein KAS46_02330 [Candidatus Aureabacteria bacterium]|nr:hypothetical protein [Candidatus Auribacterota bacterium]
MEKKRKFDLNEIKALLQENGYTIASGLNLSYNTATESCGSYCTGGCRGGCYTCSTGTSKKTTQVVQPAIQISRENILDNILTITNAPAVRKK